MTPEGGPRRPACPPARPVLAIDTSTDYCGVAVARGPDVLYERSVLAPRRHSEVLHPAVAAAFGSLGWDPAVSGADLLGIGVTVGPGSFTGLRIGIAAATGLAAAWRLPVVGLSSLAVLAAGAVLATGAALPGFPAPAGAEGPSGSGLAAVAAAIPTRTGDCYAALFVPVAAAERVRQVGGIVVERPENAIGQLRKVAAGRFRTILLCGHAWRSLGSLGEGCERLEDNELDCPAPGVLAVLASRALMQGKGLPPEAVTPVYVRRSGAT